MATVTTLDSLREKRKVEMRTPYVPEDLVHYEDGAWECSTQSLAKMQKSFTYFGLALDPAVSFDELYSDLSFIFKATSLLPRLGYGNIEKTCSPQMLEYLHALRSSDLRAITATAPAARQAE